MNRSLSRRITVAILSATTLGAMLYWTYSLVWADPPAAPLSINAVTHSRVEELRRQLCLTNEDLASLGCDRARAEAILSALVAWFGQNATNWTDMERAGRAAESSRGQILQRINQGPADANASAALLLLDGHLSANIAARQQLLASGQLSVEAHLAPAQRDRWQTIRTNQSLPLRYRCVPQLTPAESHALSTAIFKHGADSPYLAAVETSLLVGLRATEVEEASARVRQHMPEVLAAERAILPPPRQHQSTAP